MKNFGDLLRYWRKQRGRSQLDLSLDSGISQRYISFIESGRSTPSRDMVHGLAQVLDIPLRERNTLLLAAGYAPFYKVDSINDEIMLPVTKALQRMLDQHEPHPAVIMDRNWNILMTNKGAPQFFNKFIDLEARQGPKNILHLMFDPDGMRPFLKNWETVVVGLLQRLRVETIGHIIDDETRQFMKELLQYPDIPEIAAKPYSPSPTPIIPLEFSKDGQTFSYFSMITTVGAPQCITAQELRVECMYPAE